MASLGHNGLRAMPHDCLSISSPQPLDSWFNISSAKYQQHKAFDVYLLLVWSIYAPNSQVNKVNDGFSRIERSSFVNVLLAIQIALSRCDNFGSGHTGWAKCDWLHQSHHFDLDHKKIYRLLTSIWIYMNEGGHQQTYITLSPLVAIKCNFVDDISRNPFSCKYLNFIF